MGRPRTKLPRRTQKMRVDELLGWYERNAPGGGPKRIPVHMSRKTLEKFAQPTESDKIYSYRGRELVIE